ncbi:MAG TPA: discoidin domain-containing protein [Prolixibacteraceae bacterium]|nr:discoidin domain-containing protein [Prolixibacteraceae bacterium]
MKKLFIINRTVSLLFSIFLLALVFSGCSKQDESKSDNTLNSNNTLKAAILNSPQIIIDDMTLSPDAPLHGTEAMDWGLGDPSPQPMPCPAKNYKGEWWEAMTAWGQVYIPRSGSSATNTRCQIRNVTTKLLRTNGTWETVQSGSFGGAAYVEDFANNECMDAGARDESSNGGGQSFIVGVGAWAGHNYHFYTNGRAFVDVNNCVGVYTTCEARLIMSDTGGTDDRNNCKNLMQMGADWWLNTTIGFLPDWSANSGIGGMRSKWVTNDWQSYSMCTLTPAQIAANPPVGAPIGGGDLALNHSTNASSVQTGYSASNAVDGNSGTRWGSAESDPQWIYVDLGTTQTINQVKLSWETAYGQSYQIQVSDDATNWTDIYSTSTGNGGIDDLTGLSGSGRYVRMNGTARGTAWGYSLWSFEVYGN